MDTEEFEQIPWSQLLPEADASRQRILYIIAGVVVALVAGVIAARSLRGPGSTVATLPPPAAPAAVAEIPTDPTVPPPVTESTTSTPPPKQVAVLSEADLMAVLPEEEGRAAAAFAEWFVTDFFTVDGGTGSRERMTAAVDDELSPMLPHGQDAAGLSYVEWARATRVEPAGTSEYDVLVAFGRVASAGEGPIVRQPVQIVEVSVRFTAMGEPSIVGLPQPQTITQLGSATLTLEQAPAAAVDRAVETATMHGTDPEAVGAYQTDRGWEIVVLVTDPASGIRWPFAIVADA